MGGKVKMNRSLRCENSRLDCGNPLDGKGDGKALFFSVPLNIEEKVGLIARTVVIGRHVRNRPPLRPVYPYLYVHSHKRCPISIVDVAINVHDG